MRKTSLLVLIPSAIAFFGVILYTYGATTISTSIVTGGDLTVSGAAALSTTLAVTGVSTLTGDLVVDTDTLYVDVSTDRTGVGTTTPSAMFSVGEDAGTVTGDVYFTGGLTLGNAKIHSIDGAIAFGIRTADPTAQEGLIYYNSTSKVLKMSDGTDWFAVGTTTSGLALSGTNNTKITLSDLTTQYMTFGTTSQSGFSVLTLEATTTDAIPFTIRGYNAQTANLLQIHDVGSAELFAIDALGYASTTMISTTGNLWIGGNATTTALTGAIATQGNVTIGGILDVTGVSTFTDQGIFLGGATTTTLILLNGETIDNAINNVIRINATSSVSGFATTTGLGIIMPRSVAADAVVDCSPAQDGGLIWVSTRKILCVCDGAADAWLQATTTGACIY
ncbi:MAG: hypothetical protein Q8N81_03450 [bacterium]|nr:hypothetical protein [bacterium]